MKLNTKQISEIAEYLDSGHICYVHKKTGEITAISDFENCWDYEDEYKAELEKEVKSFEQNKKAYLKFEPMDSQMSYKIREAFIYEIVEDDLQKILEKALKSPKPFQKFKAIIDNTGGNLRKYWFFFLKTKYEEWVKEQLDWKLHPNNLS